VTTEAMERRLDQDFADAYEGSDLYRRVNGQSNCTWKVGPHAAKSARWPRLLAEATTCCSWQDRWPLPVALLPALMSGSSAQHSRHCKLA
jgi:hypothetical protein